MIGFVVIGKAAGQQVEELLPARAGFVLLGHHVGVCRRYAGKSVVRERGRGEAGRLPALVVDVGDETEALGFLGGQPFALSVVGLQQFRDFGLLAAAGRGVDVEHTSVHRLLRLKLLREPFLVGTAHVGGALVYEEKRVFAHPAFLARHGHDGGGGGAQAVDLSGNECGVLRQQVVDGQRVVHVSAEGVNPHGDAFRAEGFYAVELRAHLTGGVLVLVSRPSLVADLAVDLYHGFLGAFVQESYGGLSSHL